MKSLNLVQKYETDGTDDQKHTETENLIEPR